MTPGERILRDGRRTLAMSYLVAAACFAFGAWCVWQSFSSGKVWYFTTLAAINFLSCSVNMVSAGRLRRSLADYLRR